VAIKKNSPAGAKNPFIVYISATVTPHCIVLKIISFSSITWIPSSVLIKSTAGCDRARATGREMREGGIADAIIYATAQRNRAKVVTGDPHFRRLPAVIFAGKE